MPDPIHSLQSMADLVVEANRRSIDLLRAVRQTRELINQSRDLLVLYPADVVMGRHLARYASIERAATRLV